MMKVADSQKGTFSASVCRKCVCAVASICSSPVRLISEAAGSAPHKLILLLNALASTRKATSAMSVECNSTHPAPQLPLIILSCQPLDLSGFLFLALNYQWEFFLAVIGYLAKYIQVPTQIMPPFYCKIFCYKAISMEFWYIAIS